MLAAAFVALSVGQVITICMLTCGAISLAYVLGLDEGAYRGRRQALLWARNLDENGRQQLANQARAEVGHREL